MKRIAIKRGVLVTLAIVSVVVVAASGVTGSDWQRAGNAGRAGVNDTVFFFEDFESYSSVNDPAFQATWIKGDRFGTGVWAFVPHDAGKALSLSHPVWDHVSVTSSQSFPFRRVVECEVMNTDFGDNWYGALLWAYTCEGGGVIMHYRPFGQDFIIYYKINEQFPYGEYYTCGSNIAISTGQWYKMKIEMDEEHLRYYYDLGAGYQLLCELDHDYSLLDGPVHLSQQGHDASEGVFDNLTVLAWGEPPPGQIPTLTEWGLIIFGVVLLGFITYVFLRRRKTVVSLR